MGTDQQRPSWPDLVIDVVGFLLAFAFGYLVGERRALRAAETPASRALDMTRPDGKEPTLKGLVGLIEQLAEVATVDALTGVRSRYRVTLDLAAAVARAHEHGSWLGVVSVDLDHFKRVNDTYGHQAGDAVLGEVGRRLMQVVGDEYCVGRLGGEEFLIVLPRCDGEVAQAVAERALTEIRAAPINVGSAELRVTASAGAVASYGDHCTLDTMVQAADKAMYEAKDAGRDRVVLGEVPRTGLAKP